MHINLLRWIASAGFAAAILIVVAACSDIAPTPNTSTAVVSWAPLFVQVAIEQGETKTATVSVTSTKSIGNATLLLTPSISSFVTLQSSSISVLANQPTTITLTVSASNVSANAEIDGVLQISGPLAQNDLPIHISVLPASISEGTMSVSYDVPLQWSRSPREADNRVFDAIYTPGSTQEIESGSPLTPPDIFVEIVPNPGTLPVAQFANSYLGGWFTSYTDISTTSISGYSAMLFDDQADTIPAASPKAVLIQVDDHIVVITVGWSALGEFPSFLSSVKIGVGG